MDKLRVLIADDDDGMRLVLRKLIEKEEGFELVAEATDGMTAVELAVEHKPDVAFLDIDMPKLSGLACARAICSENPDIAVIFATAHDQYMSDAFELYAYDYLIKPFDIRRVRRTLQRLRERMMSGVTEPPPATKSGRLTLKGRDGISFVAPENLFFAERVERETILVTTEGEMSTNEGLNELEERLAVYGFMRSHRSFLVNPRLVVRAVPYGRWTYALHFKGTERTALITNEKLEEL